MRNRLLQFAAAILITTLLSPSLLAQTEPTDDAVTQELLAVFAMRFDIAPPDSQFTELETGEGWEEKTSQSKITCSALPAPFEQVLKDTGDIVSSAEMRVISKGPLAVNGIPGYLVRAEFIPPPEEKSREPFYGLMYMRPLDRKFTLNINAAYPKSQHERLYPAMLASFATVRKRTE